MANQQKKWEDMSNQEKKQGIIGAIVVVALLILVFTISPDLGIFHRHKSSSNKTTETSQEVNAEPKPQTPSLANRLDSSLKKNIGYDSYQDSGQPFEYITGMKDQGHGWVDVNYQTDCDKDTATSVARQIVGTTEIDVSDLQTVNVICTNGTSSYANRDSWAK